MSTNLLIATQIYLHSIILITINRDFINHTFCLHVIIKKCTSQIIHTNMVLILYAPYLCSEVIAYCVSIFQSL